MSQNERFSFSAHIPSFKLVTGLPDSCKGWAKGHVLVFGPWSGSSEGLDVDASKRNHKVLLSDKNLLALINDPKSFIIPVFPHVAPPSLIPNEHFMMKDLPIYERVKTLPLAPSSSPLASFFSSSLSSSASSSKPDIRVDQVVPPIISPPPMLAPSTIATEITLKPDEKLPSADDIAHHEPRRPSISPNHFSEESFDYMASSHFRPKSSYVPNQEKLEYGISYSCMLSSSTGLEAVETMRAYLAHHMDRSEALLASLETTKSEVAATRRIVEE
ncbi:hypothetical protein CK203_102296 [Vitis vinifera]|uniref:Uncharacterized protein n=1 Tax=Vitis vinifera TaxID=29760 RepID=A0A438DC96_VITVI|nr:hypothetical protein CK203_102296 [Vitis vinifera]